jgi:hypothetical protein
VVRQHAFSNLPTGQTAGQKHLAVAREPFFELPLDEVANAHEEKEDYNHD